MERTRPGKNNWIGVIFIIAILIGAFFFVSRAHKITLPSQQAPASATNISELPIFKDGLSAAGVKADQIGFHSFTPDGTYFFFSAFTKGGNPANAAYLVKLADGTVVSLQAMAQGSLADSRVIQLAGADGKTILYFIGSGQTKSFDFGQNVGMGALSPDGSIYVVNTAEGIKKIDVNTGLATSFSKDQYDGAFAWYPDGNRMLGYKDTGENLFEAGKGRTLGVWDMNTGDFTPLDTTITDKNIRLVQWVVPGVVARVNTGWDDGSHDYLVNVDMRQAVDAGDTSGALSGGVVIDQADGLFAVVGGDDASVTGSNVLMYRGIEKVHSVTLPKGYFRSNAEIVDADHLIYIRTQRTNGPVTAQALVELDLKSGTETVLRDIPAKDIISLSLSPDHKTWVLSDGNTFITASL